MWWEERYWLLLDVEWEAGRQKQGSPGYCCSVGGYRQPGSPHDTVAGLRGRWTGLPLSLSLSLQLTLHAPFPVPVVLFLLPFFFFFASSPPTQSFTFRRHQSPQLSRSLHSFSLWVFLRASPTPAPHPLVLNGGFWTRRWSGGKTFSPPPRPLNSPLCSRILSLFTSSYLPAFFYVLIPPRTNSAYTRNVTDFSTYSDLSVSLPSFIWPSLCASLLYACFVLLYLLLGLRVCGQLFSVLHNWCQIGQSQSNKAVIS